MLEARYKRSHIVIPFIQSVQDKYMEAENRTLVAED